MHFYSHYIAAYRKDTGHLSLLEHGIYRQLLDTYYSTEEPLTTDDAKLMRTHCIRSADEMRAYENVIRDFFVRTDEGYIHKRCDLEIDTFHKKSNSARESSKVRWDRVRAERIANAQLNDANALRTDSERNANEPKMDAIKDVVCSINDSVTTNDLKKQTRSQKARTSESDTETEEFCTFYKQYPRKQGRVEAWKAWKRLDFEGEDELYETILSAVLLQSKSEQWQNPKFIPMPATWLNNRRWGDGVLLPERKMDAISRVFAEFEEELSER